MKLKVYIHANYDEYEKVYTYKAWSQDMSTSEYCGPLVETLEVDFTPPPHDVLVKGTIAQYREHQKKIMAEAERQRAILEQRINDMLCLEYQPEPA